MPASPSGIRKALYGIEIFDPRVHSELSHQLVRILQFQQSPASFVLQIVLEELAGNRLPRGDKKAWTVVLVYKGTLWHLYDWKNSSWTLNGPPNSNGICEELIRKLQRASSFVERRLKAQARIKIENGDFAIANQFPRLSSYYAHLRQEAEKLLSLSMVEDPVESVDWQQIESKAPGGTLIRFAGSMNDYFAKWRAADAAAAGAVLLFFGLMEVLFDACFALGDRRGLTYHQFRGKDWRERFKLVVDIKHPVAQKIYCDLKNVQRRFRNVFAHALPTLFVHDEQLGWIPESLSELTEPKMNPIYAFDKEDVRSIFSVFDEATSFFENHETTWAATMYAKTPLPIPLAPGRVAALTKHATSREAFEEEIERRLFFLDAIANGEI